MSYTADSPILGTAPLAAGWLPRLQQRADPSYSANAVASIVATYSTVCAQTGVDPNLALAQLALETGDLTSWWCLRPRRNPAGIGVTGSTTPRQPVTGAWAQRDDGIWAEGCSFATWKDDAIPAHVGRLLAFALRDRQANDAQRALIATALSYRPLAAPLRGSAPKLRQLGAKQNPTRTGWANPGNSYGDHIAAIANQVCG